MASRMPLTAMVAVIASAAIAQEPPPPLIGPTEPPPYDQQLLRLSEILGSVHYLRKLCGSGEGDTWREQMQALIDSEQPDLDRRARMIDRFNRGYDSYRAVYRSCTPSANVVVERYLEEGAKIARDITARYGK
jgi:uncharacterized protein (TIGR02301 family)